MLIVWYFSVGLRLMPSGVMQGLDDAVEVRQSCDAYTSTRATTNHHFHSINPPSSILSFPSLELILYITSLDSIIYRLSDTTSRGTQEAAASPAAQLPLLGHRLRISPFDGDPSLGKSEESYCKDGRTSISSGPGRLPIRA